MIPTVLALSLASLCAVMTLAWLIHRRTSNAGWIDTYWTFGVGAIGVIAALAPMSETANFARQAMVASLVGLWSLRLGLHILGRTRIHGDDPRYARMRMEWGATADRNFFWLLQVQAGCGFVLVAAIAIAAARPGTFPSVFDMLGLVLFALAWAGESIADRQLRRFRAGSDSRGAVCESGLWRYTRHPNYFFEWLIWAAIASVAIDPAGAYPLGWTALAAPMLMYWLLAHVSGIPPLERHLLETRKAAFEHYRARTNAFFPWFPRHP